MAPALARRPAHSVRLFCASVLLSLSVSVPRTASCQSNPASQPPQEYVLAQVKAGQEADLCAVGLHYIYTPHPDPAFASLYKRSFLKPSFRHWPSFRA